MNPLSNTLGLNIIVGPGEAIEIARCLASLDVKRFDQVVIVLTSNDEKVEEAVRKFTDKVYKFEWKSERHPYGDFAGARNLALDNTTTDYVMWCDADDVVFDEMQKRFDDLISIVKDPMNAQVEAYFIPYALAGDSTGTVASFLKERIFKRIPKFHWMHPVHEQVCSDYSDVKHVELDNFEITHLPMKPTFVSAVRNIKILEHEIDVMGSDDPLLRYFYGRDLMFTNAGDKGVAVLEKLEADEVLPELNAYTVCIDLAYYFAYTSFQARPKLGQMKNIDKTERWLRQALTYCVSGAEPYILLGDIYWEAGKPKHAERMYYTAMKKKITGLGIRAVPYYEEIPSARLGELLLGKKNYAQAVHYWYQARKHDTSNQEYADKLGYCLDKINEELNAVG